MIIWTLLLITFIATTVISIQLYIYHIRTMWIGFTILLSLIIPVIGLFLWLDSMHVHFVMNIDIILIITSIGVALCFSCNAIYVIVKTGYSKAHRNPIVFSGIFLACMILYVAFPDAGTLQNLDVLLLMNLSAFLLLFCSFLLAEITFFHRPVKGEVDFLIVHGARVINGKVTKLLSGRVNRAISIYLKQNKKPKIVLSGGQGKNESITEAQAMSDYIIRQGVPKHALLLEEQSKTTIENLIFSCNLITQRSQLEHPTIVSVSSDFHLMRILLLARKFYLNIHMAVGSKTNTYYILVFLIHEFMSTLRLYRRSMITFFIIFNIACMIYLLLK